MKYIILFMFLSLLVFAEAQTSKKLVKNVKVLKAANLKKSNITKKVDSLKKIEKKETKAQTPKTVEKHEDTKKEETKATKKHGMEHKTENHEQHNGMYVKKVDFVKKEGVLVKHNEFVKPERILPFVNEKYNSAILKGGQVFSKLKISQSHLNIKDKDKKNYVFDIHASKNVGCSKCHISEPSKSTKTTDYIGRLNILIDKGSLDNYLGIKNSHQGIKDFKVKTCIDCHKQDVEKHSKWLPATSNHMQKLSCETCHINQRNMFTAKSFNYALVNDKTEPFIDYLGKDGNKVVGFTPEHIWYKGKTDKNIKIKPVNMVSFLVWKDGKNFVNAETLKKAFYKNGKLNAEMLKVFDENKDGKLSVKEARFDNETKKKTAVEMLKKVGVKSPELKLISFPVALEHNVMPKEMATKNCASCHSRKAKSLLYKETNIMGYVPTQNIDIIIPGVKDTKLAKIVNGKIVLNKEKLPKEHFMMITDTSFEEYDKYAIILLILTLLALLGHGMLRIMFASKRNSKG